jgi:hypothetical protein
MIDHSPTEEEVEVVDANSLKQQGRPAQGKVRAVNEDGAELSPQGRPGAIKDRRALLSTQMSEDPVVCLDD